MSPKVTAILVPITGKSEPLRRIKLKLAYSLGLIIAFHYCRASASLARQAQRLPYNGTRICDPLNRCNLTFTFYFFFTEQVLAGKIGLVFGVANKRSIAWAIAKAWAAAGARLIFNYQGERLKENVEELVGEFGAGTPLYPCDVSKDEEIDSFFEKVRGQTDRLDLLLHSVAFAPKEALEGDFVSTTREAFRV